MRVTPLVVQARRQLDRHVDAAGHAALVDDHLLDGDEGGERRQQAVFEAEADDLLAQVGAHLPALQAEVVFGRQRLDAPTRPERGQHLARGLRRGESQLYLAREVARRRPPAQTHRAAPLALVAPDDDDRLGREEVGHARRIHVRDGQAAPVNRDVGEQRVAHALVEAAGRGRAVRAQRDVLDLAAPVLGQPVEQEAVDRTADAEGEDARVRVAAHLLDDLRFVADVAVGHEADDADVRRRARGGERGADGRQHLRPAAALTRFEEDAGAGAVLGRGVDGFGEEDVRVAGEGDEVEGVVGV